jgi:hypothetical protein
VEKTSRLGLKNPVASGVKCGPHGGKSSKMKSWTVSWLSLETNVKPGLHGSRVMSDDWRRLHRVHGVSSGSSENHLVPWLIHKAKAEDRRKQHQAGRTSGYQHDRCVTMQSGDFEAEDTRRDRKACIVAKQVCSRRASV